MSMVGNDCELMTSHDWQRQLSSNLVGYIKRLKLLLIVISIEYVGSWVLYCEAKGKIIDSLYYDATLTCVSILIRSGFEENVS